MSLKESLKTTVIEELKQVSINGLNFYARTNADVLTALYSIGVIDDSSIEGALEEAVFRQAQIDYYFLTGRKSHTWADHVGRPECLAYALTHGKFSPKQISRIPFNSGDSAETFLGRYGKENLLVHLREELLNPPPLPESLFEKYTDLHPACSGH